MSRLVKPLREYNPFVLGVIASVLAAALILATLAYGTLGLGKTRYSAEFASTGEITTGCEVRVAGLRVGEVTGVNLENDHVLVTFRVDHDVDLGSTSSASIKLATLVGTRYLELVPSGTGSLAGDRIPLAHTTVAYNLQDVLQTGTPLLRQLDPNLLRQSLAAAADSLRGRGPQIAAALEGMSRASDVVLARKDQFAQLIRNLDAVTKLVNDRGDQIFALLGQSNTLLKELLRRQDVIRSVLADASSLTSQLDALLKTNTPEIAPLLNNAKQLTDLVRGENDAINRTLAVIGTTSRYFTNLAGTGPYADVSMPYSLLPDNFLCRVQAIAGCTR